MRRRRSGNNFWIFFLLFIFFASDGVIPLLFISAALVFFMMKAVNAGKEREEQTYTYSHARPARTETHTSDELTSVYEYLRRHFSRKRIMDMPNGIDLVLRTKTYKSLSNLDVYRNGRRVGTLSEFRRRYNDMYEQIIDTLVSMAANDTAQTPVVAEAEVVRPKEEVKPVVQEEKKDPSKRDADYYIDVINNLNNDIPDEEISNGLYETAALLKQIKFFEEKFPDSRSKLDKLYSHYLPILTRILQQYSLLQVAKTDPSYESTYEDLKKTISLINQAMQTIISSMTDNDFINLSADMSTLEAVLQKDGLTGDSDISQAMNGRRW
ncbi:MAG: hypothetical protein E7190_00690 [Erysipelotrichaceae bacterium]|nr:hypothetical protein [Erysipelotrichaceae bacterium]